MTRSTSPAANHQRPLPDPVFITTADALHRLTDHLSRQALIAVDTESNSLYAYRERVCLIQISTREHDYIVDPLAIEDMSPLGPIFADPNIEKVFHAAEYDLICMKRDYGFQLKNLFDTMVAARICGIKNIGLGNLLKDIVGVEADKSHQRDDWGRRPLPAEGVLYAQMDTHYLPQIHDHFQKLLSEMGLLDEAHEVFEDLTGVAAASASFDPDGFWRISIPNSLRDRQVAILREIYLLREEAARDRDLPTFKIMSDRTMINIVNAAPKSYSELEKVDGVGRPTLQRYGKRILEAVKRGQTAPIPTPPPQDPPSDPIAVERYAALREWRKERAAKRGVESDVILPREALWSLAERAPNTLEEMRDIRGFGPWRRAAYGEEILSVIHRFENKRVTS